MGAQKKNGERERLQKNTFPPFCMTGEEEFLPQEGGIKRGPLGNLRSGEGGEKKQLNFGSHKASCQEDGLSPLTWHKSGWKKEKASTASLLSRKREGRKLWENEIDFASFLGHRKEGSR